MRRKRQQKKQKEAKERKTHGVISAPHQEQFEGGSSPASQPASQATAGLINSPLAAIIVHAAFEIHQRNVDLL